MKYIYLHGFASSPDSAKARFFDSKFNLVNKELKRLDLNLGDFSSITISRQLELLNKEIGDNATTLIGSSLGGLLGLLAAENNTNVKKLILLAPALELNRLWPTMLGNENMKLWQESGVFQVFHYGYGKECNLSYEFYTDMNRLNTSAFHRDINALIFHGINDETIPLKVSENYVKSKKLARLWNLDSDHSLEGQLEFIWQKVAAFIG